MLIDGATKLCCMSIDGAT